MNRRALAIASFALAVVSSSCATQKAAAPETGAEQAPITEEKVVGPPEVAWKDMTHEQQAAYMKKVVMPKMRELFSSFDQQEYGEMKCAACHGKDAKERKFEMPNPELQELPTTKEGFEELAQEHPEMMKFMAEQVKPQMAKLMGMPEFDPKNPQAGGFGCGNCHPMAGHPAHHEHHDHHED